MVTSNTKRHASHYRGMQNDQQKENTERKKEEPYIPAIFDSPLKFSEDASAPFTSRSVRSLGYDFGQWAVGFMPVDEFFDQFLPCDESTLDNMPCSKGVFDLVPWNCEEEEQMYKPIIDGIRAFSSDCEVVNTSTHAKGKGSVMPAITGYSNCIPSAKYVSGEKHYFNPGYAEWFAEIRHKEHDPFREPLPTDDLSKTSILNFDASRSYESLPQEQKMRCKILGRNTQCAAEVLAGQHRLFFFSVFISGRDVRFARWDRAGVTVSSAFDCSENPEFLCQFAWRLSHLSEAQRGYDTTVSWASDQEHELFLTTIRDYIQSNPLLSALGDSDERESELDKTLKLHYQEGIVTVLEVFDETDKENHRYIVSRPVISPTSIADRYTRGYWAVHAETGRLVFLKDTWRHSSPRARIEGRTLKTLNEANVRNVPVLKHQGDVANGTQTTHTDLYLKEKWVCKDAPGRLGLRVVPHTHYRMVSETVGYPFLTFQDSRELLSIARNVFHAICDASEKCKLLHRDISAGNVVIIRNKEVPFGVCVIDWELVCDVAEPRLPIPTSECNPEDLRAITGTWQYISARLLQRNYCMPHNIYDDIESIFWLTFWGTLVGLPHNLGESLRIVLESVFDEYTNYGHGLVEGGRGKRAVLDGEFMRKIDIPDPTLRKWLGSVRLFLRRRGAAATEYVQEREAQAFENEMDTTPDFKDVNAEHEAILKAMSPALSPLSLILDIVDRIGDDEVVGRVPRDLKELFYRVEPRGTSDNKSDWESGNSMA